MMAREKHICDYILKKGTLCGRPAVAYQLTSVIGEYKYYCSRHTCEHTIPLEKKKVSTFGSYK